MDAFKRKIPRTRVPKIALLIDLAHESSRGVIRGVFKYARHNGDWQIDLLLGTPNKFSPPDLSSWKGAGGIGQTYDEKTAQALLKSKLPFVLIDPKESFLDEKSPFFSYSSVDCDSVAVGKTAAEHLIGLGFENYAFVGDLDNSDWSATRGRTFFEETTRRGLNCAIYSPSSSLESGRSEEAETRRVARWLKRLRTPLGVFAASDWRGTQIINVCRRLGLRVPYDVAVLGVDDDVFLCRTARPELSSVGLDFEWAGYEAARILDERIRGVSVGKETSKYGPIGVVVRGSTRSDALKNPKVVEALDFIRINAGLNVGVGDVARRVGTSRQWIEKLFLKERGRAVYEEIQRVRTKTAARMIVETNLPINEIGVRCGFVDGARLAVLFKKRFGTTPSEFRAQTREKLARENENEFWSDFDDRL